jgi:hypothetical protein
VRKSSHISVPSKDESTHTVEKNYRFKENIAEYIHFISFQTEGISHTFTNLIYVSYVGKLSNA